MLEVLYDKAFRHLTRIPAQRVINRSVSMSLAPPLKVLPRSEPRGAMSSLRRLRTAFRMQKPGLMVHHYRYGEHWRRTEDVISPGDFQEAFEAGFLLRLQRTRLKLRDAAVSRPSNFDV